MRVYSLFDRKLREYGGLVLCQNDEAVKRAIHEGIPRNSTVGKYPGDYDVMFLGEFDSGSGVITASEVTKVANVEELLNG